MPKILRVINRFNLGGPVYNAVNLSKYLAPEYKTLLVGGDHAEHEASAAHILEASGVNFKVISQMQRSLNPLRDRQALL
ncbi:MAG: hypothetical protein HKN32_01025, partial [Flavobacteriales bacterium]|nr:hypothetical protein [Flavobacteriales bacterium]